MRNDQEQNKYHVKCGIFLTSDEYAYTVMPTDLHQEFRFFFKM